MIVIGVFKSSPPPHLTLTSRPRCLLVSELVKERGRRCSSRQNWKIVERTLILKMLHSCKSSYTRLSWYTL